MVFSCRLAATNEPPSSSVSGEVLEEPRGERGGGPDRDRVQHGHQHQAGRHEAQLQLPDRGPGLQHGGIWAAERAPPDPHQESSYESLLLHERLNFNQTSSKLAYFVFCQLQVKLPG